MLEWKDLGIKELLDNDLRPTFVVDVIGDEANHGPQICYRNPYFTSEFHFDDTIIWDSSEDRASFGNWALCSAAKSLVPSFDYCGFAWVANTLRGRWRIIQASTLAPYRPRGENVTKLPKALPSGADAAQIDRLKAYQLDHPSHDWTAPEPPHNPSKHVQLLRQWNWENTPLGPLDSWSPLLRLMANLIVTDPNPAVMFWGPKMAGLYNESYVKFLNDKHPKSLGEPYVDTWAELYADPATAKTLDEFWCRGIQEGKATVLDHQPFLLRNGTRLEERIFNLSLIPIFEDGNCVGFYEPLNEITIDHLNDRREKSLRKISQLTAGEEEPHRFFKSITQALADNDKDFPFALLYSMGAAMNDRSQTFSFAEALDLGTARLESFLGVAQDSNGQPIVHNVLMNDERFMRAVRAVCASAEIELFDLEDRPDIKANIMEDPPSRGFGDEPHNAVICPIIPTTHKGVVAILVLGVNPRRPYDSDYTDFVRGLARIISSSLASVLLVNEQKRLTGRAVEREQRAIAMVDVSPVGNFLMDMDGVMLYVNDKWIEMTGYEHGRNFWANSWLTVIRDEYLDIMVKEWQKLAKEKIQVNLELALKKNWDGIDSSTGQRISGPVYIIAAASVQTIGENEYITGALTDISYQKWVESLQSQRRQEAVELKRQQENFMDMTSHEMRNPLSAIFQCADAIVSVLTKHQLETRASTRRTRSAALASSLANNEDPIEYAIETAGIITLCAQHQKRIVDDVLILSKVDANLIEVHPIDVQPRVLVENSVKMFGAEVKANDVHMSFEIEESFYQLQIDWVKLDPGRLLQVLINLCTNAIKFTAESKTRDIVITMGASTEVPSQSSHGVQYLHQPTDQRFADPTNNNEWGNGQKVYLQFQVKDTGRGMSAEEMKLLFQRFSQASPRTHTQYGGSGLGLFIARLLSRLQGGEIGVLTSPGHGSTFAFYIATKQARTAHGTGLHTQLPEINTPIGVVNPHSPTPTQPHLAPKTCADITILIVEDNLVNQRVLQKQLLSCGFNVQIANNGQEALVIVEQSQFRRGNEKSGNPLSLILMDIEMPVMNGTDATKKIRFFQTEGLLIGHIPIIAITANARIEHITFARESGMDEVVSKPFRIPELLAKIELFIGPLVRVSNSV